MSHPLPTSRALATQTDAKVFGLLAGGPATRTEISQKLGISKPTASLAITRLQQFGLVSEGISTAGGKRGRIPEVYSLRQDYGHVQAVELSAQKLVVSAYDLAGSELALLCENIDSQVTADQLFELAGKLLMQLQREVRSPLLAAGISQAAPVLHAEDGSVQVVRTPIFDASATDLVNLYEPGTPLLLDNDVNWMAVAEQQQRAGSMFLVYIGAGIGSALVVDGVVYRGRHGIAGELETQVVNGKTLLQHLDEAGLVNNGVIFEDFAEPKQRQALVEPLGAVLGNLVGFLDPDVLVVTGPGASQELCSQLSQVMGKFSPLAATPVEYSSEGGTRALEGAKSGALNLALDQLWRKYREA